MRITKITTADQRTAAGSAMRAADAVRERIADAVLVELSADLEGVAPYKPLNVWGAGEDSGTEYNTRELLWCDIPGEAGHHLLTAADVTRLTGLLSVAGTADPNVFEPGELASGCWELDIDAVLEFWLDDLTDRLVDLIAALKIDDIDLDDLVETAGALPEGADQDAHIAANEAIQEANDEGVRAQARFLIDRLGEAEAFAAVDVRRAV